MVGPTVFHGVSMQLNGYRSILGVWPCHQSSDLQGSAMQRGVVATNAPIQWCRHDCHGGRRRIERSHPGLFFDTEVLGPL